LKTEILTIGDEILIGQIVDTNSSWIAHRLADENISVNRMISLSDNREEMLSIIDQSFKRSDIVIVTGGLGPTKDDLTKAVLAEYFESGWRWDQESLDILEGFFKERNRVIKEINKKQAYLPSNCETIINKWGTAPGMLFKKSGKILISLPGVPFEMKNMMEAYVIPEIKKFYSPNPLLVHHFFTVNIPESLLSERLAFVEDVLPKNIKLAYLPNLNIVRLRLTCQTNNNSNDRMLFMNFVEQIRHELGQSVVVEKDISFEEYIAGVLLEKGKTISFAESCSGGLISHRFTLIPGISKVFKGSIVCYSNESKGNMLGVPKNLIDTVGVVSSEVVEIMAENCRKNFKTDYALSVSGIAGPDGGTDTKPVGLVFIGLSTPNGNYSHKCLFPGERSRVMERTFVAALDILRMEIVK